MNIESDDFDLCTYSLFNDITCILSANLTPIDSVMFFVVNF